MKRKKTKNWMAKLSRFLLPLVLILVLIWFSAALSGVERGQKEEGMRQLEDSIRRAAVACFAAEGVYPPDLDYLVEHYGIQIDEEQYFVHYEAIGENLMPEITVISQE